MKPIALAAILLAAMPAFAQQTSGGPSAPRCTQLELSAGITGARCGTMTVQEIGEMITREHDSMS